MMCHRSRGPLRAHVIVLMAPMLTMASGCLISWLQFGGGDGHSSNNTSETTLTASNVSSLHRVWQANLGDTADGAPVYLLNASTPSGNMTLVFATTRGGRIVAVNEATGAVVWEYEMDAGSTGTLMTHMYKARQYIVVAIGGQNHPAEFVAFALGGARRDTSIAAR